MTKYLVGWVVQGQHRFICRDGPYTTDVWEATDYGSSANARRVVDDVSDRDFRTAYGVYQVDVTQSYKITLLEN